MSVGKIFSTELIAALIGSRLSHVSAQTAPAKKTFQEDISLQFYVNDDYSITVEGIIELTNISGKDLSLTEYGMNLPYFTLKDTKIGYIHPKAFLVDMYSQNNSILFTFKSQYTKPVVIGKNGKITFTFSAELDKPYRDLGGLRTLTFPFTFSEEGRSLRITVTVDEKVALIYAPHVAESLKKKHIYTVTEETGKLFLFAISDKPFSMSVTHSAEVLAPQLGIEKNCEEYLPVSCIGCSDMKELSNPPETIIQSAKNANAVTLNFSKTINRSCAQTRYDASSFASAKNGDFRAGFVISPLSNQLIPAMWRVATDGKTSYVKDITTQGVPYIYADALGYLTVPLKACSTDELCKQAADQLSTIDTSLLSGETLLSPGVDTEQTPTLSIVQENRRFYLQITNATDSFLKVPPISLNNNSYFTLQEQPSRFISPKSSVIIPLTTRNSIQTSNQETALIFSLNQKTIAVPFRPITITILAIIEILAYIFIVVLGVTILASGSLILYNRLYEKK